MYIQTTKNLAKGQRKSFKVSRCKSAQEEFFNYYRLQMTINKVLTENNDNDLFVSVIGMNSEN